MDYILAAAAIFIVALIIVYSIHKTKVPRVSKPETEVVDIDPDAEPNG